MKAHIGCGIRNPFRALNWVGLAVFQVLLWTLLAAGLFPWNIIISLIVWAAFLSPVIWWELRHRTKTMFRTWWP